MIEDSDKTKINKNVNNDELNSIKKISITNSRESSTIIMDECVICLENLLECESNKIKILSCQHKFHKLCINDWILVKIECNKIIKNKKDLYNNINLIKCPLCLQSIKKKDLPKINKNIFKINKQRISFFDNINLDLQDYQNIYNNVREKTLLPR